jgi:hypothetical protein
MSAFPPEAQWVTDMRRYFAEHGCYRQSDLQRLLGNPWDRVAFDKNGNAVLTPPSGSI